MKKKILLLLILLNTNLVDAQIPLEENCSQNIPSLCDGEISPNIYSGFTASTSQNVLPSGPDYGCLSTWGLANPSFFYFEASINGPLTIIIEPVDAAGNPLLGINQPDLDFICWGPFNSTANMCSQLTATNEQDCEVFGTAGLGIGVETCEITNAIAGGIYVILVTNWAGTANTTAPDPCFIQFTTSNPVSCCEFAGDNNSIDVCPTDSPFDLITALNNNPSSGGTWENSSGSTVNNIFNPSIDTGGTYNYIITGTSSCDADTSLLEINMTIPPALSITSSLNICSESSPITLTAIPVGGVFSGTNVSGNTFDPLIVGNNNITYTYIANGCTTILNENMTVFESPTVLSIDEIINNPICAGNSDGNISINASGGLPPYIYSWSSSSSTASSLTNLQQGVYTYTVTDNNSCSYSNTLTLNDPTLLSTLTTYNSNCYGENNGAIAINTIGATTPPGTVSDPLNTLAYCLSSPNLTEFGASPGAIIEEIKLIGDNFNINHNTAGTIDLYEDYTDNITLGIPDLYADITENQFYTIYVTLNGTAPGASNSTNKSGGKVFIDFNIDGDFDDIGEEIGIIPYGLNSSANLSFTVPVTNVYGPTRLRVVSQNRQDEDPSIIGPCDYADPSIQYSTPWFGATEDYSIILSAPISSANYQWDNGETSDSISNLSPGEYTVTITHSGGCIQQDTAQIFEPEQILFNATINEISCNNADDGSVILNPSGGNNGSYQIDWGTINPLNLGGGVYSVTVSDPNTITTNNLVACENDTTIILTEPDYFSVDFSTSSNEICFSDPITLNFDFNQGGISPFTVNYTENGNSFTFGPIINTGISNYPISPNPGNNEYIITNIIDANGCVNQNTIDLESVFVNQLPDINISVAPNPICEDKDAVLSFNVLNGTPPFNIDYQNGIIPASENNVTGAGSNIALISPSTTTYTLTYVTDSKGCESYLTDNTTLIVNEIPDLSLSYPTEFCEGELIEVDLKFLRGNPPFNIDYTYGITNTSTVINNLQGTLSFVSANPTNITINTITSANCTNDIDESISVTTNPLPIAVISGDSVLCGNEDAEAEVTITTDTGNPFYEITYTNGITTETISNADDIETFLTNIPGTYTLVSVIDALGCEAINMSGTASINIYPLPDAKINAYPTQTEITDPLVYFDDRSENQLSAIWDFGDGQTQASNFNTINHIYSDTGTYQVSLTTISADGCTNIAYETIIISPTFNIYIPSAFTPNNDLDNDHFMPITEGLNEYNLSIFDRWGKKVFETTDYSNEYCIKGCPEAWNGTINNGEYGQSGLYVYRLIITDLNGKLRKFEGPINMIR